MTSTATARPERRQTPPRRRSWARRVGRILARLAIFLCVVIPGAALPDVALGAEPPPVLVNGRPVDITSISFTVSDAAQAGGVDLKPGPVHSAATHSVIAYDGPIPDLLLDGRRVDPDAGVDHGDRLHIEPVIDTIERVVPRPGASVVTHEGLPDVEHTLFHPGHSAIVDQRVGARSGEVVSEAVRSPAVPPKPVKDKLVALTFDDGPHPTWTPMVLEILKDEGVVATFCLVGHMVQASLALAKKIVAEGHLVCNHTSNHALLGGASEAQVVREVNGGAETLKALTGVEPAFYRPPGGQMSPTVVAAVHERGQRVLHWSLDTADYQRPPAEVLVDRVMRNVGPGAVVLMHDGGGDRAETVAALRPIIQALKAEGYGFTTPAAVTPVPRT